MRTQTKEFEFNSVEDFQALVAKKDFSISKVVVNAILNNLKTRKKTINMFSVKCAKEDAIFDITLEKANFVDTLKENLKYYEKHELYEECSRIHKAIQQLS